MKAFLFLLSVALLPIFAIAGTNENQLVNETITVTVYAPGDFNFTCSPGVASNGNNYPTVSDFDLWNIDGILPSANTRNIGALDDKDRLGDHCKELSAEFASILPATLTVTRIVTEVYHWNSGGCVKGLYEELSGTIGNYHLSGSSIFSIGQVDTSLCPYGGK